MHRIISTLTQHKRHLSLRAIASALLFISGLVIFLSVYDGIREKADLSSLDAPILSWTIASYNPVLATAMRFITDATSPVSLGALTVIGALLWAWRKKEVWRPSLLVSAMAVAYILAGIIKTFTARARPTVTDLLHANAAISYSFPSGHTVGIAVLLFVLSYFFYTAAPTLRRMTLSIALSIIGIATVAFSRIYLGYHWLTDVTASVGLALVVIAIVIAVDTYLPMWWRRRHTTSTVA